MSTTHTPYTGNVEVAGPSDRRTLTHLIIRKIAVGPMDNNVYLLTCRVSGAQMLIDAATDTPRLLRLVREGSPTSRLDHILTTHAHDDHVGSLAQLQQATGARTLAGKDDASAIQAHIDQELEHGDVIRVGVNDLHIIHVRGHTPGSVAVLFHTKDDGAHLFTGDSLFPGGLGATQGDRQRFRQLFEDVSERVFARLPDDTWVYPGHGADTTLGAERPHLEQWRERGW